VIVTSNFNALLTRENRGLPYLSAVLTV